MSADIPPEWAVHVPHVEAECRLCGRAPGPGVPCVAKPFHVGGRKITAVAFGDETWWQGDRACTPAFCGECGTPLGAPHHWGCWHEECPVHLGSDPMNCPCVTSSEKPAPCADVARARRVRPRFRPGGAP